MEAADEKSKKAGLIVRQAALELAGVGHHKLPPLPYAYDALEPFISEETLRFHHDKHHAAYVDGLNEAEKELESGRARSDMAYMSYWTGKEAFNWGGHILHDIYWNCLSPNGGGGPHGALAFLIRRDFGSYQKFLDQFKRVTKQVEGSGWGVLVLRKSPVGLRLSIAAVKNHEDKVLWNSEILLPVDVWEHAYYLDYKNDREGYLDVVFDHLVDWEYVDGRLQRALNHHPLNLKGASQIEKMQRQGSYRKRASDNEPTNPKLWGKIQRLVSGDVAHITHDGERIEGPNDGKGFKIHPSAYSNGWASALYKRLGGGWKKVGRGKAKKDVGHGGLDEWFSGHGGAKGKGEDATWGDWVAISPVKRKLENKTVHPGDIVGPCAQSDNPDFEKLTDGGKDPLKCMPRQKAYDMPKKERAEKAKEKLRAEKKDKNRGKNPTRTPTFKEKQEKQRKSQKSASNSQEKRLDSGVMRELRYRVATRWMEAKLRRDGESVGLFFRLPSNLADKFPSLKPHDDSPAHVTLMVVGDVEKDRYEDLLNTLRRSLKGFHAPMANLEGLDHFVHAEQGRAVGHVKVDFDKDVSGLRHRLKQDLSEAGFPVQDQWVEFKPHVTLAYMDGVDSRYEGEVPSGSWLADEVEVWGLPEIHKIPLRDPLAQKVAMRHLQSAAHNKSIAMMKFLSRVADQHRVGRHVYVVGGAVRNFLIDRPIKDIDVVVDSVASGMDSEAFAKAVAKAIPVPTNLTTNQYGVAILTVKGNWELDGENLKGEVLEIANARKESYGGAGGKGYKPSDVVPATIEEDLLRREFSFNTLLWRLMDLANGPEKAEVIDLTGCGIKDLRERNLRCPRDPDIVFSDDPTRMLRAIKFTGKYGFKIPPDVVRSIQKNAPKMKRMPWEAIATLLVENVLNEPTARKSLQQMQKLGLLKVISEMIQEQKPFAAYMANQLRKNRKVQLLLDLMDLGVPAQTPLSFLDRQEQQRLRELTVSMPEDKASQFVDLLIKPPVDNREVIDRLSLEGAQRGEITPLARKLILRDPSLAMNGRKLTQEVIRNYG